jgi:hypothetical protein
LSDEPLHVVAPPQAPAFPGAILDIGNNTRSLYPLREIGFRQVAVIGPEAINARYFDGRSDVLRVGAIIRFAHARV